MHKTALQNKELPGLNWKECRGWENSVYEIEKRREINRKQISNRKNEQNQKWDLWKVTDLTKLLLKIQI